MNLHNYFLFFAGNKFKNDFEIGMTILCFRRRPQQFSHPQSYLLPEVFVKRCYVLKIICVMIKKDSLQIFIKSQVISSSER